MRSCRGVSRCCVCHPAAVMIVALSSEPIPQTQSSLFDSSKMPQVTRIAHAPPRTRSRGTGTDALPRRCGTACKIP
jgi:hypothetical protein